MNRVLIIGGAGFIGSHTADLYYKNGYEITILDSLNEKSHNNNWPKYLNPSYNLVKGDVNDSDLLLSLLKKTDYICHFAAEMDLNPDFSKFINVNVGSTALIYELLIKYNICIKKVLIASSQFVYGEGKYLDGMNIVFPKDRSIQNFKSNKWDFYDNEGNVLQYLYNREDDIVSPPNHYALSKYFQEEFAMRMGKLYSIPTVAMRYSIVHGIRQSLKNSYSGALRTFVLSVLSEMKFATFEDNLTKRDFVAVEDVANANLIVLENDLANYQIFNCGGGIEISITDLAKIVCEKFNIELQFNEKIEYRLGDIRNAISDISKLKNLGWSPLIDERTTVSRYIDWVLEQKPDIEKFRYTQKYLRENNIIRSLN